MGLRKYKREIARERMKLARIDRMNHKGYVLNNGKMVHGKSPFSKLWRKFLDPKDDCYKSWHRMALRMEAERVMQLRRANADIPKNPKKKT